MEVKGGEKVEAERERIVLQQTVKSEEVPETEEVTETETEPPREEPDLDEVGDRGPAAVVVPPWDPKGPGEMGRAVKLEGVDEETKIKIDKGWQDNAFNQYASDIISLHRSLPDMRFVSNAT